MNLEDLENNEPLCEKIMESIPKGARPAWGVSLIKTIMPFIEEVPKEVNELIAIIEDGSKLSDTKHQFIKINDFATANPNYFPAAFLMLAEGVAKMTYTETGLPEPFGIQAGWYVSLSAKRTADKINDVSLDEEITKIIFSKL